MQPRYCHYNKQHLCLFQPDAEEWKQRYEEITVVTQGGESEREKEKERNFYLEDNTISSMKQHSNFPFMGNCAPLEIV